MEILGIGPLEFVFIVLIALIVLGPKDLVKAGRTLGSWMRKIVTSPEWRSVQQASREIRHLPTRLMRESSLEEVSADLKNLGQIGGQVEHKPLKPQDNFPADNLSAWTTPPGMPIPPSTEYPKESKEDEPR